MYDNYSSTIVPNLVLLSLKVQLFVRQVYVCYLTSWQTAFCLYMVQLLT